MIDLPWGLTYFELLGLVLVGELVYWTLRRTRLVAGRRLLQERRLNCAKHNHRYGGRSATLALAPA